MALSHLAPLVLAAAVAGAMNAMAGGGTIVTFPTLVFLGVPAITANATSTVALLPGSAASVFGYRREVATHRGWLSSLFLPSLLGGTAGGVLLLATPAPTFEHLAPFLVLFATVLFMVRGALARRARSVAEAEAAALGSRRWLAASLAQLGVATYGGYFGAGAGILMLAVLGFLGLRDIHAMNGLKNFFGVAINAVAATYFIARGAVDWPAALVMAGGAALGGYGGAHFARSIGQDRARRAVVVIGLLVTAALFWQQLSTHG